MKVLLTLSLLLFLAVVPSCKKKAATGKADAGATAGQTQPVENVVRPVAVHASGDAWQNPGTGQAGRTIRRTRRKR